MKVKIPATAGRSAALPRRFNLFWSFLINCLADHEAIKENWGHLLNKSKILTHFELEELWKNRLLQYTDLVQCKIDDNFKNLKANSKIRAMCPVFVHSSQRGKTSRNQQINHLRFFKYMNFLINLTVNFSENRLIIQK